MANDILDDTTNSSEPLTQNDILAELADDLTSDAPLEDESDDSEVEEKEPESEEKPEGDEEQEIELKDESDDLEYVDIPDRKKILKEFPELFKKFPGIEKAIYREKEYDRLFGTIAEAKTAKESLESFNNLQNDLFSGNLENILSEVKRSDSNAFSQITENLLATLQKVDQPAYFNTVNHVIKHAISAAFEHGKNLGDEDGQQLQIAAQLLNKFIYNSTQITRPETKVQQKQDDPKAKELSERERQFNERQLTTAVNDVTGRINSTLKAAVDKYLDPKQLMSGYVRANAHRDVMSMVDREINGDERFRAHLDRLWQAAMKSGYSDESKARIRQAVIERAKTILPGAIKRVRADAIKGSSSVQRKKKEEVEQPEIRRQAAPKSSSSSNNNDRPRRLGSVKDVMKALE